MAFEIPIDIQSAAVSKGDKYRFEFSVKRNIPFVNVENLVIDKFSDNKDFTIDRVYLDNETGKINVIATVKGNGTPFLVVFGILVAGSAALLWLVGLNLDRVYKIIETPVGALLTGGAAIIGILAALKFFR